MTSADPVRVLIADSDRSSRAGVGITLAKHGFDTCAEAASAQEAVALAHSVRPDICLVDADLPGGGLAAVEQILAAAPETAVVMLSGTVDHERLLDAIRAGARGYLLKDMDPERLPRTLRGVLDGEAALPRALVGRVLEELRAADHGRHASELARLGIRLTYRQREILELLDRGLDTAAIGEVLSISPVTVRRHISEILRRLSVSDREAALRLVREQDS
jgi:DNA-binding NarL/FixJ family response regulator